MRKYVTLCFQAPVTHPCKLLSENFVAVTQSFDDISRRESQRYIDWNKAEGNTVSTATFYKDAGSDPYLPNITKVALANDTEHALYQVVLLNKNRTITIETYTASADGYPDYSNYSGWLDTATSKTSKHTYQVQDAAGCQLVEQTTLPKPK